jgi:hypothetical protein
MMPSFTSTADPSLAGPTDLPARRFPGCDRRSSLSQSTQPGSLIWGDKPDWVLALGQKMGQPRCSYSQAYAAAAHVLDDTRGVGARLIAGNGSLSPSSPGQPLYLPTQRAPCRVLPLLHSVPTRPGPSTWATRLAEWAERRYPRSGMCASRDYSPDRVPDLAGTQTCALCAVSHGARPDVLTITLRHPGKDCQKHSGEEFTDVRTKGRVLESAGHHIAERNAHRSQCYQTIALPSISGPGFVERSPCSITRPLAVP